MNRWFPGHIPNQPACGRIRAHHAGFIFLSKSIQIGGDSLGVCTQDDGVENVWPVTLE